MKTLIIVFITLLCFTKGNAQWYKADSKTTENIYDIFFVDKNVGYCIAGDGILKSIDGGDSWSKIYTNNDNKSFGYTVAYKDTVIAFVGDYSINYKYTSVDNGNTWENEEIDYIPLDVQYSNNNIFFRESSTLKKLSNGIITTISDDATVYGVNKDEIVSLNYFADTIRKSVNNGLTWKVIPIALHNNIGSNQLNRAKIKSFNDTIILATTYPSEISFSYDNGTNWIQNSLEEGPSINNTPLNFQAALVP